MQRGTLIAAAAVLAVAAGLWLWLGVSESESAPVEVREEGQGKEPTEVETMHEEDGEKEIPELVSAEAAARRFICLSALNTRGAFEAVMKMPEQQPDLPAEAAETLIEEHEKLADELNEWLREEGLWRHLSTEEKSLMTRAAGAWSMQETIDATWRLEAAGVFAWALGFVDELPLYDAQFDQKAVTKHAGLFKSSREVIEKARLRSEDEIREARETTEFWLWRARTAMLMQEPEEYEVPPETDFEEIVLKAAQKGKEDGLFEPIGNDFPAFGKAYRDLSEQEWNEMRSIAYERLYGLNWLCGYADDWDDIRCDT